MIAATSLVVVVALVVLIGRLGALALIASGVPAEVARFQARSALTGVGFTTSESESVVNHPVRRRILMTLMLAGNAGLVTVAGAIVLSLTSSGDSRDVLGRVAVMAVGIAVVVFLMHRPRVESAITSVLTRVLNRFSDLELRDDHQLMRLSSDQAVIELAVQSGDWLADRTLAALDLPDEGVIVLAILRQGGEFVGAPRGEARLAPGDTVYLYGRGDVVENLDHRPATADGQREHQRAVQEQQRRRVRRRRGPRPATGGTHLGGDSIAGADGSA